MPQPKPRANEGRDDFLGRCMGDGVMRDEFPDRDQRFAVCNTIWRDRHKEADAMPFDSFDRKTLDHEFELKALSETGEFEGLASVFNVEDQVRDIVAPGAFKKSLRAAKRRGRMPALLWQHDSREPIGAWLDMRETDEGLYAKGKLLINEIPRAKQAHALLQAGGLSGLSIGFQTIMSEMNDKTGVRTLTEVELWEVSLVTFPALDVARVANVKAKIAGGDVPTRREMEYWLTREIGCSRKRARALLSGGYEEFAVTQDADGDEADEVTQDADIKAAVSAEEIARQWGFYTALREGLGRA